MGVLVQSCRERLKELSAEPYTVMRKFLLMLSITLFLQVLETEMKRFGIDDLTEIQQK
jgi:hypothetical protein